MSAAKFIDRFGAQAVYGRPMGVYEMIDIVTSENIYNAYQSRENYRDKSGAPNWAEWASKYPDASRMLNEIAKEIANGE